MKKVYIIAVYGIFTSVSKSCVVDQKLEVDSLWEWECVDWPRVFSYSDLDSESNPPQDMIVAFPEPILRQNSSPDVLPAITNEPQLEEIELMAPEPKVEPSVEPEKPKQEEEPKQEPSKEDPKKPFSMATEYPELADKFWFMKNLDQIPGQSPIFLALHRYFGEYFADYRLHRAENPLWTPSMGIYKTLEALEAMHDPRFGTSEATCDQEYLGHYTQLIAYILNDMNIGILKEESFFYEFAAIGPRALNEVRDLYTPMTFVRFMKNCLRAGVKTGAQNPPIVSPHKTLLDRYLVLRKLVYPIKLTSGIHALNRAKIQGLPISTIEAIKNLIQAWITEYTKSQHYLESISLEYNIGFGLSFIYVYAKLNDLKVYPQICSELLSRPKKLMDDYFIWEQSADGILLKSLLKRIGDCPTPPKKLRDAYKLYREVKLNWYRKF